MSVDFLAFGRFVIDRSARRLYIDGTQAAVSSPGLRLLLALLDRPGNLVPKEELMARVWGSAAVTENALQVQIAALRKLVGDQFILTTRGVGYRFTGRVQVLPQLDSARSGYSTATEAGADALRPAGHRQESTAPAGLVGRATELRDLLELLTSARIITLTGPGGVGKSSLARALAEAAGAAFPDGAWFVELAAAHDEDSIIAAVNAALNIEGGFDAPPLAYLLARLQPMRALLVLDNCEHVLPAAARLADAFSAGGGDLAIVATSQEKLSCRGERVVSVAPLLIADPDTHCIGSARRSPAFQLLCGRIRALDANFMMDDRQACIAARICQNLDGLPLALEIAAGWASLIGLEALEAKLATTPIIWSRSPGRAAAGRRDLAATLEWSHGLLSQAEQLVFRRISAFAHAFPLRAAEAVVCDAAVPEDNVFAHLASLVQKSMVAFIPNTQPPAYRLLETTRAFALEKLRRAAEEDTVRSRHAQDLLRSLIVAEREWDAIGGAEWLQRYAGLIGEVRGALGWAIGCGRDTEMGIAIAGLSWPLWHELSLRVEGAQWLSAAIREILPSTPPALEAQLRQGHGVMYLDSKPPLSKAEFEIAAALWRRIGDDRHLHAALYHLAGALFFLGEADRAEQLSQEACALGERVGSQRARARAYSLQLAIYLSRNQFDAAREAGRRSMRLFQAAGADHCVLTVQCNMIEVAIASADVTTAIVESRTILARLRATDHTSTLCIASVNLVAALVLAGQLQESLDAAIEVAPALRGSRRLFLLFDHLALRCALLNQFQEAAMLSGFSDRSYKDRGWPRQQVEDCSRERLLPLLAAALAMDEAAELIQDGASLTESNAWEIATAV